MSKRSPFGGRPPKQSRQRKHSLGKTKLSQKESTKLVEQMFAYHRQGLPEIKISSFQRFMEAVKLLPCEEKDAIIRFYGLDGQPPLSMRWTITPDYVLQQVHQCANVALYHLSTIDYLRMYDTRFSDICLRIEKKLNMDDKSLKHMFASESFYEEVKKENIGLKLVFLFYTFICGGRKLAFKIINKDENLDFLQVAGYDPYEIIKKVGEDFSAFQPKTFKISAVAEFIMHMKDVGEDFIEKLLKIFGIIECKETSFLTFAELLDFKEKFFTAGPWELFEKLIVGPENWKRDPLTIKDRMLLRQIVEREELDKVVTPNGRKKNGYPAIRLGSRIYTDLREIIFCRESETYL